jgi:hypothetical protein
MDLREELAAAAEDAARPRQPLYRALLAAEVWAAGPGVDAYALTQPETGRRAVPAFLTEEAARTFWAGAAPGRAVPLAQMRFAELAANARTVGAVVLDPAGAGVLLDRAELAQLAAEEVPGEFGDWLRAPDRLGRASAEVLARLRRAHVQVITGKAGDEEQRLYMLEKSEDGTLAVACFSSPETLAQFAEIRRLSQKDAGYGVALVTGEHCTRVAAGMGAYVLLDPESPWETQLEPTLL